MTEDADAIAAGNYFLIAGMTLQGSSLTPDDRVLVTDADGSILADYLIQSATDNADLMNGREPIYADGITVESFPASGAVLTIFLA